MVTNHYCFTDPYNTKRKRTAQNTEASEFNCAGYAFGTMSWYCPYDLSDQSEYYRLNESGDLDAVEEIAIRHILDEIKGIILVDENIVRNRAFNQRKYAAVVFRYEAEATEGLGFSDFHVVRLSTNGKWYHKMGGSPGIHLMEEEEVFDDYGWENEFYHYNRKPFYFLVPRRG